MLDKQIGAHTFTTRKIEKDPGKLDAISRYLGHSRVSITVDLYCHIELTDEDLWDDELFVDMV